MFGHDDCQATGTCRNWPGWKASDMERVTYDLPEGQVHVDVLAAVEDSHHEEGTGRVRVVYPALRVTTYPAGPNGQFDAPGFVKLRGKRYSLDHVHLRTPWDQRPWTTDGRTYYQQYTKTEAGNSLDWRSPTGERLHEIDQAVRDRFAAEHPEWERESRRKRAERMIRHAEGLAADARVKAAEYDAEAEKLRAELEAL